MLRTKVSKFIKYMLTNMSLDCAVCMLEIEFAHSEDSELLSLYFLKQSFRFHVFSFLMKVINEDFNYFLKYSMKSVTPKIF